MRPEALWLQRQSHDESGHTGPAPPSPRLG